MAYVNKVHAQILKSYQLFRSGLIHLAKVKGMLFNNYTLGFRLAVPTNGYTCFIILKKTFLEAYQLHKYTFGHVIFLK